MDCEDGKGIRVKQAAEQGGLSGQGKNSIAVLMNPERARKLWPWRILTSVFVVKSCIVIIITISIIITID